MDFMSHLNHTFDAESSTLRIVVDGEILSTNVDQIRSGIFGLLDGEKAVLEKWSVLNLDVSKSQMIDSAGLNLVVMLTKFVKNRGAKMAVTVHNPNIHRTFLFTRLDKQLDLVVV